jgi:hypothetical protein
MVGDSKATIFGVISGVHRSMLLKPMLAELKATAENMTCPYFMRATALSLA